MSRRPLILVTNDDGISAPGIRTLISAMNEIGDVVVVAPDSPQSAMGHAITINSTLHCNSIKIDDGPQEEYSCSGTPADCVKLGINEILDRKPDICVSGINHGSNSSINVIYSGTMSAAVEASIEGIPAIGFSLLDYSWNADFNPIKKFLIEITKKALNEGIPKGNALNVNFPKLKENVMLRNFGIKAVEAGIIHLSQDQRSFTFGSNKRKLMAVPFDENPYSALAAWFKTDEGVEVYKTIDKKLS